MTDPHPHATPESPPLHVLLIEDNPDDATLTQYHLERSRRCPFVIEWKPNLSEGLARLGQGGIDVVILDLSLPDSRGLETFDQVSAEFRHIPILVLSGDDDEEVALQAVRLGAQDYQVKGRMNGDSLARSICYAVEREQATRQISAYAEELAVKNAMLQEELKLAHEIQRALLPASEEVPESAPLPWTVCHRHLPTESLAGDFFKIHPLSEGRVGVLICDVMGHGVRSALIAALLCGLIEECEFERESPGLMLTRLNAGLRRMLGNYCGDIFATACYAVLDPARRRLTFANAGHPDPYLLRDDSGPVSPLTGSRGPALGLFPDVEYVESEMEVSPNDILLLFTDGLSEVENAEGVFFEKVLPSFLETQGKRALEPLVEGLIANARQFSANGEFHDDVCVITLQVRETGVPEASVGRKVGASV